MTVEEYLRAHKESTTLEVFQQAYRAFIGKPLTVRHYSKVKEDTEKYIRTKKDPPHYVLFFLTHHRRTAAYPL